MSAQDEKIKMPFVIAKYEPLPEAISLGKRGRHLGIDATGKYLKLASRQPIQGFDDRACLKYLKVEDSD